MPAIVKLLFIVVLQTVRKLCQPTSDWAQYARQLAQQQLGEKQLVTVQMTPSDENQLNDENKETSNALMTTRC